MDTPVGSMGAEKIDYQLLQMLADLVDSVEEFHALSNGKTVLYWHLLSVLAEHIKIDEQSQT